MNFLNVNQLLAAKKGIKKRFISTKVWSFLFCQNSIYQFVRSTTSGFTELNKLKVSRPLLLPVIKFEIIALNERIISLDTYIFPVHERKQTFSDCDTVR